MSFRRWRASRGFAPAAGYVLALILVLVAVGVQSTVPATTSCPKQTAAFANIIPQNVLRESQTAAVGPCPAPFGGELCSLAPAAPTQASPDAATRIEPGPANFNTKVVCQPGRDYVVKIAGGKVSKAPIVQCSTSDTEKLHTDLSPEQMKGEFALMTEYRRPKCTDKDAQGWGEQEKSVVTSRTVHKRLTQAALSMYRPFLMRQVGSAA